MNILVTGGRGFIGSHFVEECLKLGYSVTDIDCITYAGNKTLPWDGNPNYELIQTDIAKIEHLPSCDILVNFAAESHVDNSISAPSKFLHTNLYGVFNLLELIRGKPIYERPLFFQISTDEVYGDIVGGQFYESSVLKPGNPYAASKASAEMLLLSYHKTYDIKYMITRCTNNYGSRQFKEKLIPKSIDCIRNNKKIPLHGDGSYVRDWIYVKDHVSAIIFLMNQQIKNQIFNVCSDMPMTNLEVVNKVLEWENITKNRYNYYEYVENRWGQDLRYSISNKKIKDLGWSPTYSEFLYKWY